MDKRFLVKAALSVALCIPPWGGEWLTPQAKAQGEAFAFAPKWADMLDPAATLAIAGVPVSTEANRYHGQAATLSQFVRTDENGNVLLFGVDGNIYDGQGYLIADVKTDDPDDCNQCVEPGVMEMICTPVPGLCGVFYIFSMRSQYDPGELSDQYYSSRLSVAILDINLPNVYHQGRFGSLIYISQASGAPYGMSHVDQYLEASYSGFAGWAQHSGKGRSTSPMMRIIDPTGNGEMYWLFVIGTTVVTVYQVDGEGLVPIQYADDFIPIRSDWAAGQNNVEKAYYRDASVIKVAPNEIRLAITDKGVSGWTYNSSYDFEGSAAVVWMRFNATDGSLIGNTVHGILTSEGLPSYYVSGTQPTNLPAGYSGGPAGIAWLNDGERFLLAGDVVESGNWVHKVGIFNVTTNDWTDLTQSFGEQYPEDYFYARFNRNSVNGGIMNALYLPKANGLAAILTADGTPLWQPAITTNSPVAPPQYEPPSGSTLYAPRFINAQVVNDPHLGNWEFVSDACCATQQDFMGQPGYTVTQGNTSGTPWQPQANPFGGGSEVVITSDLTIGNSIDLYIENMTFRFAPGARLILKPGTYARFKNCVLTSYTCDNARWPGVRVEGNTELDQSDATDMQGRLYLDHTTVSNAVIGVLCAKEVYGSNNDPYSYGGVLWTYYATFKNNLIGAQLGWYGDNYNSQGIEDNRSYFNYTTFITDDEWPDNYFPSYHLDIQKTRKVNVTLCTFANDATLGPIVGQGNGLHAYRAEVKVTGSSSNNPTLGFVRNLRRGIIKEGGPDEPITVDRMRFSGNWIGIDDVGGHLSRYINNTFNVPDAVIPRYGIKLNQSRFFTVERNTFTGSVHNANNSHRSVGIWFKGILPDQARPWNYEDERIYDNDFTDLHTGCLVNGMHISWDFVQDHHGLMIFCGDFLNNTEDVGIADRSLVRPNQFVTDPPQLAGNRFLDAADCTTNYDWLLDPNWNVNTEPYEDLVITYLRNEDPLCAATCPDPVEDDFLDLPEPGSDLFNESQDCGSGNLDLGRSRQQAEAAYAQARTYSVQVKALLDGLTDGGYKPDLIAELEQDHPWLGSGFLRDRLLLNSPLSNEVLRAMIERTEPMDQWHVTQVCIENSPLDPGILSLLKPPMLGIFFYQMVLDAQQGLGPSTKQLLQEELMLRRGQQAAAFADVGWLWATDTVNPGGQDSLRTNLLHDAGLDHRWERMAMALLAGDMTMAAARFGEVREQNGSMQLQQVIAMGTNHGGNWALLDSTEVDTMVTFAQSGVQGAALYESILEGHNLAEVENEARFPDKFRSMHVGEETKATVEAAYDIAAYPTPADRSTWLTYPSELTGTTFSIQDAQGRTVQQGRFMGGGVMELDCGALANGLYAIVSSEGSGKGRLLVKR